MTYPHADPDHEQLTDAELDARAEALWKKVVVRPCGAWAETVARLRSYAAKSPAGKPRKTKEEKGA